MKEPVTVNKSVNYWCTWASQNFVAKNKGYKEGLTIDDFAGAKGAERARAEMTEELIFGEDGFAYQFPDERGELYLVLDDGWDVPPDVSTEKDTSAFGSLILDEKRFPSFTGTPAERLKKLNEKLRDIGWMGLGLWVSPQMCGELFDTDFEAEREIHEKYWAERILWCKEADVGYLKIDWGKNDNIEYRRMMSALKEKYFPELIMEHATPTVPVNGYPWENKIRYTDTANRAARGKEMCTFSDIFRSYDVTDDMLSATTTLDRLSYFLSFSDCIINCEDELYIGAVLGCSVGIMRSSYGKDLFRMNTRLDEIKASVKWQKYAPSFAGGILNVSDNVLTDSMFFSSSDTWYEQIMNTEVSQAAPAVMARSTELPTVTCGERAPFVIASKNPSGAYSIATIKRRKYLFDTDAPCVVCNVGTSERVAVFGDFESIVLNFDTAPKTAYAESLINGTEEELDLSSLLCESKVTVSSSLLKKFNTVTDNSDNAVMFKFEF